MHAFTFNVNVGSYPKKLVASSYLLELVPDVQVCARGVYLPMCTCVCCGVFL